MCNDCMARVPYATLIATIMCCLGVGIFCGTMYRGVTLGSLMMDQVKCYNFHTKVTLDIYYKFKMLQGISFTTWLARSCTIDFCNDWC